MTIEMLLQELDTIRQQAADMEAYLTRLLVENKFYDDTDDEDLVNEFGYDEEEAQELATG
jgi:hypothetical protein